MKVFVTGTRGIPNIPGGVESHCSQLYPLLAQHGFNIRIARRSSYVKEKMLSWEGVSLVDLFSPKSKTFEAIVHTFLALLEARKWGADIIHIHAIGPGLMVPPPRSAPNRIDKSLLVGCSLCCLTISILGLDDQLNRPDERRRKMSNSSIQYDE